MTTRKCDNCKCIST